MDSRDKLKHLEFLQAIITRMATNSFLLKGWGVTLVAALFALAGKDAKPQFFIVAYLSIGLFWILDGYFLSQERRFRALYDDVRSKANDQIDFSMETRRFNKGRDTWVSSLLSVTLLLFYVPFAGVMLLVMSSIR